MSKFTSYCVLAGSALALSAASARANVLLYSFETGDTPNAVDGFAKNGSGSTVTQSTTGVTAGANSGLFTVTAAGFAGDITAKLDPVLTTPSANAPTAISADLTVPAGFTYTGGYALLGVTIFGLSPDPTTGDSVPTQFQVAGPSEQQIPFTTPGTTVSRSIALVGADPDPNGSGDTITYGQALDEGFLPTSFQFFFDKNAAITLAIDNVQAVTPAAVPEPASLGIIGIAGLTLVGRRRRQRA